MNELEIDKIIIWCYDNDRFFSNEMVFVLVFVFFNSLKIVCLICNLNDILSF